MQVIAPTIVSAQHQGAGQADQFLGFATEGPGLVGLAIEVEHPLHQLGIGVEDAPIHADTEFVKSSDLIRMSS